MRSPLRSRIVKWVLGAALSFLGVAALYVGVLVYPTPLFAHAALHDGFRIYSDTPIPPDVADVVQELRSRIEAMDHAPPDPEPRIYLCDSPRRYALFAFLARKSPESLAIVLSLPNEIFVSMTRIRSFREAYQGRLRHTRFEGNLSEAIAHEIAHLAAGAVPGRSSRRSQPWWKSEGWAEYQANLGPIRADPGYDLHERIEQLLDDGLWVGRPPLARSLWESQLLVEFLAGVRGYGLADLIGEEVTLSSARTEMMEWHRQPSTSDSAGGVGGQAGWK